MPVNLGTGTGCTVLEVIAAASRAVGRELPYKVVDRRPGDIAATWADPTLGSRAAGMAGRPHPRRDGRRPLALAVGQSGRLLGRLTVRPDGYLRRLTLRPGRLPGRLALRPGR